MWVAGGYGTNRLAYSYDGINWTASSSGTAIIKDQCKSITWNGTRWIAVGSQATTGDSCVAYSSDGITWTSSVSGNTYIFNGNAACARRLITYPGPLHQTLGGTGQSSAGGSVAINFSSSTFGNVTPIITAAVTGNVPAFISVNSFGPTGFTAYTYNTSGTQTGPVGFNWMGVHP
jgi:hypothetical protein